MQRDIDILITSLQGDNSNHWKTTMARAKEDNRIKILRDFFKLN